MPIKLDNMCSRERPSIAYVVLSLYKGYSGLQILIQNTVNFNFWMICISIKRCSSLLSLLLFIHEVFYELNYQRNREILSATWQTTQINPHSLFVSRPTVRDIIVKWRESRGMKNKNNEGCWNDAHARKHLKISTANQGKKAINLL